METHYSVRFHTALLTTAMTTVFQRTIRMSRSHISEIKKLMSEILICVDLTHSRVEKHEVPDSVSYVCVGGDKCNFCTKHLLIM